MLVEIERLNYLWLKTAQRMLREDRAAGKALLRVPEQMADVLITLSAEQLARLARSNQLLCRFGLDDHAMLHALAENRAKVPMLEDEGASVTGTDRQSHFLTVPLSD